jgi:Uma2 family endonuclease
VAMPDLVRRYTRQEVLQFPNDGKRYELVRGELLVSPPPALRHQIVVQRLFRELVEYLKPLGREETVVCVAGDISWNDETLVIPDLFVAPPEEMRSSWSAVKTLLLAIEVLSPRSTRADRVLKRHVYQENRVATYWIVDHRAGLAEIWHPRDTRPTIVSDVLRWRVEPGAPEIQIELASLLRGLPD